MRDPVLQLIHDLERATEVRERKISDATDLLFKPNSVQEYKAVVYAAWREHGDAVNAANEAYAQRCKDSQ